MYDISREIRALFPKNGGGRGAALLRAGTLPPDSGPRREKTACGICFCLCFFYICHKPSLGGIILSLNKNRVPMWTILLSCVLFAWYLYALVTFFRGAGRNGWSAWWLLPILICPPSVVVLLARTRRAQLRAAQASAPELRAADRRVKASGWFLAACIAAMLVPGVVVYYRVMDGASAELLHTVPAWETVCLVAVAALYLLCLWAGRAVTASR